MQVHDEVCGMTIDSDQAPGSIRFHGKSYYFCSDRCLAKFREHPGWYVPVEEEEEEEEEDALDRKEPGGGTST